MELTTLDPEHGGAPKLRVSYEEGVIYLGRNPSTQIADTKVSRRHASVTYDKTLEHWVFAALTLKPCYYKHDTNDWDLVNKGETISLSNGDQISLLQDKYIYEFRSTTTVSDKDETPKSPEETLESVLKHSTPVKTEKSKEVSTNDERADSQVESEPSKKATNERAMSPVESEPSKRATVERPTSPVESEKPKPVNRGSPTEPKLSPFKTGKRVLPDWMLDGDDKRKDLSTPSKQERKKAAEAKAKQKNLTTPKPNTANKSPPKPRAAAKKKGIVYDEDDNEESEIEKQKLSPKTKRGRSPKKSPKKSDAREEVAEPKSSPSKKLEVSKETHHQLSDSDGDEAEILPTTKRFENLLKSPPTKTAKDNDSDWESEEPKSSPTKNPNNTTANHQLSDSDDDADASNAKEPETNAKEPPAETSSPRPSAPQMRKRCVFGSGCYRKNLQHKIDQAHPGDPDYQETDDESKVDDEADETKPECEYGLTCYRKNPQHRKDFKHTQNPEKPKRAAAKRAAAKKSPKKKAKKDDESETYDSSFIDDTDEEDLTPDEDEEEEWVPTDSD